MPLSNSPFGGLPTNLPQVQGLPMPTPVQGGRMQPMPDVMQVPRMPEMPAPQRSEFETLISGIGGLMKQSRDEEEKKQRAEDAKALIAQLTALSAQKNQAKADDGKISGSDATNSLTGSARGDAVNSWQPGSGGAYVGSGDLEDYMARNAKFESGANEGAVNPGSGATGLFQFLPSTWNWISKEAPDLGLTPEGIKTREQQMKAMRYYTQKSANILKPILGRAPTGGELYLLHLLGHSGGPAVLSDIDAPITKTIGEGAYRGNPFLRQYGTGRDLIAGLNRTFGGAA